MSESGNIFVRQHQGLMGIGAEVIQAMHGGQDDDALRKVRTLMARFKGALLVHQRMENDALYPRLLTHADPAIAREAQLLYEELGDVYDAFVGFEARFGSAAAIQGDVIAYYAAIKSLLKRLFRRMQREDRELYALAERADVRTPSVAPPAAEDFEQLSSADERTRWQSAITWPQSR